MRARIALAMMVAAIAALGLAVPRPAAQTPASPPTEAPATPASAKKAVPRVSPRRFASSEDAVQALVAALRSGDTKALLSVLGSEGRTLVSSGDDVADRQARERFVQAYDAKHELVKTAREVTVRVGTDSWPLPIPVIKVGERWRFDPRRGREEILARRIGRNELNTMQVCLAYVDAQREYYARDRTGTGILEYAQKFASSPGRHDGLYWTAAANEAPSPLGDLVVRAYAEGYRRSTSGGPTPYHGYLYRILTAQGPDAPGGAYDYVVGGHMFAGFGLVAFPAQYGVSGVMTFIVNHDGIVYQKDLGPRTHALASAMRQYNPDATWTRVDVAAAEQP